MPEAIRILFVGELQSSHARSWIDLLSAKSIFSVEGVHLGGGDCDVGFPARNALPTGRSLPVRILRRLDRLRYASWTEDIRDFYTYGDPTSQIGAVLAALREFEPHIVHTFGFTPAALLYGTVPETLRAGVRWVLQTRGGSDVAYTRRNAGWQRLFRRFLPQADIVLCDNLENYRIFEALGIQVTRSARLSFVPGTGGIDCKDFEPVKPLHQRERLLIWNKAYESRWSKALPVLEGLHIAWDAIAPVKCIFTAVDMEMRDHVRLLSEEMQKSIELYDRIPRAEMLSLMREARVILAPSLVDGIPNTLYEAMAAGAIPVVSPLPSIAPHFADGENVFYARNLYPEEIASAVIRAFASPHVGDMVTANRDLVERMASREMIAQAVTAMYLDVFKGVVAMESAHA